jgi:hypothetical protein
MTFKEQFQQDIDNVFFNTDEGASTVVYKPKEGIDVTIEALSEFGMSLEMSSFGASEISNIMIKKSDVDKPKYGDEIAIDGEYWTVQRTLWSNHGAHYVEIRRDERVNFRG